MHFAEECDAQNQRVRLALSEGAGFGAWWDKNEAQYFADSCHMSDYHMAALIWRAAYRHITAELNNVPSENRYDT